MQRVNNVAVRVLPPQEGYGNKKARGYKLFSEPYANIFCLARKKSGETTVIFEILRRCTSPKTKIVIVCFTANKDYIYKQMIKFFRERGNEVSVYTHLKDGAGSVIDAELENLMDVEEDEKGEPVVKKPALNFGYVEIEVKEKKKIDKYITPEVVFVLDDLGNGLRDKSVSDLLKKNRHYRSKVILSSQYSNDLRPEAIKQLDYMLIFGNQADDKLALIYKHLDLSFDLEWFIEKYKQATHERYNFLYVDSISDELRRGFSHKFI